MVFSWLPFGFAEQLQRSIVIGASGAIYGLLLAYALYFPDRPIYMYFVFPIPARYFVLIMGAIAFYSSLGETGGIANATHLGGLLVGYLYLKGARLHLLSELKYRYLRWKINRVRKKFDVYIGRPGGRLGSPGSLTVTYNSARGIGQGRPLHPNRPCSPERCASRADRQRRARFPRRLGGIS